MEHNSTCLPRWRQPAGRTARPHRRWSAYHPRPYNVEIVTERPTTGGCDMIVFGGTPVDAGFSDGPTGHTPFACNSFFRTTPHVSFIYENYALLTNTSSLAPGG